MGLYGELKCAGMYSMFDSLPLTARGLATVYEDASCRIPIAGPYTLDGNCVRVREQDSLIQSINGAIIGSQFVLASFESSLSCEDTVTDGTMGELDTCIEHSSGLFIKAVLSGKTADKSSSSSAGAVAGGVIGGVIVVVAVIIGIFVYKKRGNGIKKPSSATDPATADPSTATASACANDSAPVPSKENATSPPSDCAADPTPCP
jgi:hypothetical protein